ncbi:putative nuclease HARBI1 [Bienertia sinuspersici]
MDDNVRRASIIIALEEMRRSIEDPVINSPEPQTSKRQPRREQGESGAEYIHRLLTENPMTCKEQLRLNRDMFVALANLMVERNLLSDGRYVKVYEQLGICLFILAKGDSYRDASDRFKHSPSTICHYFHKVLDALIALSCDIIRPHRDLTEMSPEVVNSSKYWPYFKDAVGALDGTHIEASVNDAKGVPFRNRKGTKSWNVLAACSLDRMYTFLNVGWEGSAHDVTVWKDSLTQAKYGFPHPPEG